MADIYVYFDTVGTVTDAVTGAIYSDDASVALENPTFTLVTVDDVDDETGEVDIGGTFYPIIYTKDDGLGGLEYDATLVTYYTDLNNEVKNMELIIFPDLGVDDSVFTGLTQEQCLDLIDANTTNRNILTGETTPDYPTLQSQLCPSGKACLLTFTKYDTPYIHVTAKGTDNTEYIGVYDSSQSSGSRWSGWTDLTAGGGTSDPISDNIDFTTLTDASFTGLTAEECLDAIYGDTSSNTRISIETPIDYPILQTQFCPSSKDCELEFLLLDDTFMYVTAKAHDNTEYVGIYDLAQTAGSRWSEWVETTLNGSYIHYNVAIPRGSSQTLSEIVDAQLVILYIVNSNYSATRRTSIVFTPSTSAEFIYQDFANRLAVARVNFTTGEVYCSTQSTNNTFIEDVDIYTVN